MFKFTESDKEKIEKAVQDLEKESSVELVPFFTKQSDDYEEVIYKIPLLVFAALSGVFILLQMNWMLPKEFSVTIVLSLTLCISVATLLLLLFVPQLRIMFVSKEKKNQVCSRRAELAFLEEEVFNTKSRVGVLIFVSYLEKEVIVLGDNGINKKFDASDWKKMVDDLVEGIKKGSVVDGLIAAINDCKKLVLEKNFTIEKGDTNELDNNLRVGK